MTLIHQAQPSTFNLNRITTDGLFYHLLRISLDEFTELRQKVLERQQKMELLGNQSELMEKDSRNLHQTTNKLAEKVFY